MGRPRAKQPPWRQSARTAGGAGPGKGEVVGVIRSAGHLAPVHHVDDEVEPMPRGGGPNELKILINEARHVVRGEREKAGAWTYSDDLDAHCQALIQLAPITMSLVNARRKRDEHWAAGRPVTAQKYGRRIAEAEATIIAIVKQLSSPIARERRRPGINASVGRITIDVIQRREKVRELDADGLSVHEIAARLGVNYETARRDLGKLAAAGDRS